MLNFKKSIIFFCIASVVIAVSAFTQPAAQAEKPKPKNLKVLPKNISHEELDKVMKGFNMALGVKCNFCHAPKTNGEKGLDFASDANELKNVARDMMKMTNKINKKYFKTPHEGVVQNISCITCHNGNKEPKMVEIAK